MNRKNLLLVALFALTIMGSCNKEAELPDELKEKATIETKMSTKVALMNDSIIQPKEEDFQGIQKKETSTNVTTTSTWEELYQLDGIEFFLRTQDSYFGKNSLQTNGAGQPVTFEAESGTTEAQKFYLRFLPASTGIPYMIYSFKEKNPVGIGSYQSDPNSRVLYTAQTSNPSSLFGFSWDFPTNTTNGSKGYAVQNQDIPFQGSGGPWDIYYGVITNNQGNVTLERNNNTYYQRFNIIPNDEFVIESMDMNIDGAEIVSSTPTAIAQQTVENPSNEPGSRTVTFTQAQQDNYSFRESSSVSYQYTANVSAGFSLFKIISANASFTFTTGNSTTLEYTNGGSKTITLSDAFTVPVPAQTRSVCTFNAIKHQARVPYTAVIRGLRTSKRVTISGFFEAVDYTTSTLRVENYPISSAASKNAIPSSTITVEPNKKEGK